MKKKSLIILFLFYLSRSSVLYAQQISLSTGLGVAVVETANYKTNMLTRSTSLEYEFYYNSKKKLPVNIAMAYKTFAARIDNINYSTRSALSVHASFKPYLKVTENSQVFFKLGSYYNYIFKELLEIDIPKQKISKYNLGHNIGLLAGVGIHSNISTKFIIEASIESGGDIISIYRDMNNFTLLTNNSFKIAFCYSL